MLAADASIILAHLDSTGDAVLTTAQAKFGSASLYLPGAGDFIARADVPQHDLGNSDFTIEAWIRPTSLPGASNYRAMCSKRTSGTSQFAYTFYMNGDAGGALRFDYSTSGTSTAGTATAGVPTANVWSHVAVVRSSTNITVYLNGVGGTPVSIGASTIFNSTEVLSIGKLSQSIAGNYFVGYIDSVRVTVGTARYTSNFTPPATEFPDNSTDDPNWSNVSLLVRGDSVMATSFHHVDDLHMVSAFTPPALSYTAVPVTQSLLDVHFGGRGKIYGTVKIDADPADVPVHRRVRLMRDRDGVCIREMWSDAVTGAYEFDYVDERERYTVISYDHTHDYRAVVADNLTAELIP